MTNLARIETNNMIQINTMDDLQRMAKMFTVSSLFNTNNIAEVAVKIQAGLEFGLKPFAAISNIHIISGKATLSANLMAATIKASGKYNYKIKEHNYERCLLEMFERIDGVWESQGVSEFSMKDAELAKLLGNKTWSKYAKAMLFSRCVSQAFRWYCPDLFMGASVYTSEELGAVVNEDGSAVTDKNGNVVMEATVVNNNAPVDQPVEQAPAKEPLPFKTLPQAYAWASELLGISEDEAKDIMASVEPLNGKKSRPFWAAVLDIKATQDQLEQEHQSESEASTEEVDAEIVE